MKSFSNNIKSSPSNSVAHNTGRLPKKVQIGSASSNRNPRQMVTETGVSNSVEDGGLHGTRTNVNQSTVDNNVATTLHHIIPRNRLKEAWNKMVSNNQMESYKQQFSSIITNALAYEGKPIAQQKDSVQNPNTVVTTGDPVNRTGWRSESRTKAQVEDAISKLKTIPGNSTSEIVINKTSELSTQYDNARDNWNGINSVLAEKRNKLNRYNERLVRLGSEHENYRTIQDHKIYSEQEIAGLEQELQQATTIKDQCEAELEEYKLKHPQRLEGRHLESINALEIAYQWTPGNIHLV